uniref:Zinc finger protein 704 n=1 Tax=Sphaeramia orbicularis TaxID=375764 RepID=A0A672YBM1_9TELE
MILPLSRLCYYFQRHYKATIKVGPNDLTFSYSQKLEGGSLSPEAADDQRVVEVKRVSRDPDTRSVSLLEQKRKVVSSSIDVPHARRSEEEVDMDKVTAAMVLTSLSTSPLVRSPPVKVSEGLSGSWKDNGSAGPFTPSSNSSSGGYWSWSAPSDQSNPSTPSPPLSADSFKPFRVPSLGGVGPGPAGPEDPSLDEQDGSSLLFDEPIPRKRKNSMKVMFKCLWKNCGKVLSTAAGIQRHIRTIHLGRNYDSDCSDGEEDFYYTEIKLNTDSVADGLSSLSPASPSVLSPPPPLPSPLPSLNQPSDSHRPQQGSDVKEPHAGGTTPLSRSAPSALYLIHTDHAYQATAPVSIPSSSSNSNGSASTSFTPTNSSSFSISWQSPPVTFTGNTVSPSKSQGFGEQRSQTIAVLSSPPRATTALSRKVRGEGKKCRKVYGMENRDMWCTACRWKKACQRFTD